MGLDNIKNNVNILKNIIGGFYEKLSRQKVWQVTCLKEI